MNKKGFTIIELLAVISILAIIGAILTPSIINIFNSSKEDEIESLNNTIKTASSLYISDNKYNNEIYTIENNEKIINIKLKNLYQKGYIKNKLKNPYTKEELSEDTIIIARYNKQKNKYEYEYSIE